MHYTLTWALLQHSSNVNFLTGEIDGFLLGDRGYPCQPTLMTPYPEPEPGPQQRFNVAHCRTRARVEMTIGLLKARFQCLRHLRVTPERACDIIAACVVLHNIAIIRGEQHPALQIQDPEEDPIHPADFRDGRVVRDIICRNFFNQQPPTKETKWINTNHNNLFGLLYFLQIQKQLLDFHILPIIISVYT